MRSGFLIVDKPSGLRSTACVELVRRLFGRGAKVGHAGTLDSPATGLLALLVGEATRLADVLMSLPKVYQVEGCFGAETSTDDAAGSPLRRCPLPSDDVRLLRGALTAFLGWRSQTPPSVSAVHVEGVRAHERARKGQEFEIASRPVFIETLELLSPMDETGRFRLRVRCRKGTYIRSLVRDLGRFLGSAAHVVVLRRTGLGPFGEGDAVGVDRLLDSPRAKLGEFLRPVSDLTGALPTYTDGSSGMGERIRRGIAVSLSDFSRLSFGGAPGAPVLLLSPPGASLCTLDERGNLRPKVNLSLGSGGGEEKK